jgi:anti-sigma B factor antagonist
MGSQSPGDRTGLSRFAVTPFDIEQRPLSDDCLQIRIGGELDLATVDRLLEALEDTLSSPVHVILDLQPCSFLDSTGIAAILRGRRQLADRGRVLCVVGAGGAVERVLDITGLMASDLVKDDLETALLACGLPAATV